MVTPYGDVIPLPAERAASGKACVFDTVDVGATAGNFAENTAGKERCNARVCACARHALSRALSPG